MPAILAIETSCDETAAAVSRGAAIISSVVKTQTIHSPYGGVVPELASREHLFYINKIIAEALRQAKTDLDGVDLIAYTAKPGLIGSLLVGKLAAQTLAWLKKKPLIAVDHIKAHALSALIENPRSLKAPYLALVVSGGHTDLILVGDYSKNFKCLGSTRDDAAGEAFDKVAKLLGLPYPGGPHIEKLASKGNPSSVKFPRPYMEETWDFSFSGLKTAVLYFLRKNYPSGKPIPAPRKADIAASFQKAVIDTLIEKTVRAAKHFRLKRIALGGGVAANETFVKNFSQRAKSEGLEFYFPSKKYCGDNAAMVALAAYYMMANG